VITNAAECRPSWDLIWNGSCFSRDFCRVHKFNHYAGPRTLFNFTARIGFAVEDFPGWVWKAIKPKHSTIKQSLRSDSLGESVWWNFLNTDQWFRNSGIQKKDSTYDSSTPISIIWSFADNHPVLKEPSWWSFDNYLLISKLQTVEAHFNCSSLLSSANYVPAISTHINVHSFAHSFWAVKLYNLQVMCHTR